MPSVPVFFRAGWSLTRAIVRRDRDALTLDQLRSDLSHEPASKLGRLAGMAQSWRRGEFREADAADVRAVIADLERLVQRHARLACARPRTTREALGVLADLDRLREVLGAAGREGAMSPRAAALFAAHLESLRAGARRLVEALSSRFAARLLDLARAATEEMRRELGRDDSSGVEIAFEGPEQLAATWVPATDVAAWSDLIRNLARNAVQACEDRVLASAPVAPGSPLRVTVSVRAMPDAPGTVIEVADAGVGMSPEAIDSMWRAGRSSHGDQRGQGLTEGKRSFLLARARLEVRSEPGVGTNVRVAVPYRDVPVRVPRLWQMPTLLPVPIALLAIAAASPLLVGPRPVASVDADNTSLVRALDAKGHVVWQRDLGEPATPNWRAMWNADNPGELPRAPHPLLAGADGGTSDVILATRPSQGPGHLWRLGADGRVVWKRTLAWEHPRVVHMGNLRSVFQMLVPWDARVPQAVAVNVRDEDYSSTAIQFFSTDGESLGTYSHPGQLEYAGATDLDGDGHPEVLLAGMNNALAEEPRFLGGGAGPVPVVGCVLALTPPRVNGQAYPWLNWPGMPHASEYAYLALPPLPHRVDAGVMRMHVAPAGPHGAARLEVQLSDGRIYRLDERLRPIECGVGDRTPADSLLPILAARPLWYLRDGALASIDVPIRRGS